MNKTENPNRTDRGSRIFTVVVLALLGALILSAIIVPLAVFRSRGEVIVSYGSVTVRRDLYVYWLSLYKYDYLTEHPGAPDTPEYWNAVTESGITRAEEVQAKADAWIKRTVFAAAFFEEDDGALTKKQLSDLEGAYTRLLQYELNTEKEYNKAAKPIGFRYSTARRALFYQTEGETYVGSMRDEDFDAFCALAENEVKIRGAAAKINFASVGTDARLYSAPFLPKG